MRNFKNRILIIKSICSKVEVIECMLIKDKGPLTEACFLEMSLRSRAYITSLAPTTSRPKSSLSSMVE